MKKEIDGQAIMRDFTQEDMGNESDVWEVLDDEITASEVVDEGPVGEDEAAEEFSESVETTVVEADAHKDLPTVFTRRLLPSTTNPELKLELRLYKDRKSKLNYRARLSWKEYTNAYVEHYCNTEEEALAWAGAEETEKKLEKKLNPEALKDLSGGIRFRSALKSLDKARGGEDIQTYFNKFPELVERLSKVPMAKLSEKEIKRALGECFDNDTKEVDVNEAIRHINEAFGLFTTYGVMKAWKRVAYLHRSKDPFLKAMKSSLRPRVMPEEMLRELYEICREELIEDSYYLALLMLFTMRISCEEIAALDFCDIRSIIDGGKDGAEWTMPTDEILLLRIRRFYHTPKAGDESGHVVFASANPYLYRSIVIPPHTVVALKEYVESKGDSAVGNAPLITARNDNKRVTPAALRRAFSRILARFGMEVLDRNLFLPSKDGITHDKHITLKAGIKVLRCTAEYMMKYVCKFQPHELHHYLGRAPVDTIDAYYWDANNLLARVREYAKLARWDLRSDDNSSVKEALWRCITTMVEDKVFAPPRGLTISQHLTIEGAAGAHIAVILKAKYGFNCRYIVSHSEAPNESDLTVGEAENKNENK